MGQKSPPSLAVGEHDNIKGGSLKLVAPFLEVFVSFFDLPGEVRFAHRPGMTKLKAMRCKILEEQKSFPS